MSEEKVFGDTNTTEVAFDSSLTEDQLLSRLESGLSATVKLENPFVSSNSSRGNPFIKTNVLSRKRTLRDIKRKYFEGFRKENLLENKTIDIVNVDSKTTTRFIGSLDSNIKKIRDFLITEIAPLDVALDPAIEEASQILRIITEDTEVETSFKHIRTLLNDAINLKVIEFLASNLKLSNDLKGKLLNEYFESKTGASKRNIYEVLQSMVK